MSWLRFCNFVIKGFKGYQPLKTKENAKICSNFVAASNLWVFILVFASQVQFSLYFSYKYLKNSSYTYLLSVNSKVKLLHCITDDMYRKLYIPLPT